jgi:hypothetical protein
MNLWDRMVAPEGRFGTIFQFMALTALAGCIVKYDPSEFEEPKEPRDTSTVEPGDSEPDQPVDSTPTEDSGEVEDTEGPPPINHPPRIRSVRISPSTLYADSTATCVVEARDPDDDPLEYEYSWYNETMGWSVGSGETIELDPSDTLPSETLVCTATVRDPSGEEDTSEARTELSCGLSELSSLSDLNVEVTIVFRPYITDDVRPGYGGLPWDWDGDIPDEVFDLANDLLGIVDIVTTVYPQPDLMTFQEALDALIELAAMVDEYAPIFLAATVPPDPDLYPYGADAAGYPHAYYEDDGRWQWEDSYEISASARHQDLNSYPWMCLDLEDIDLMLDDNMGDFLDQGDYPVMLSWEIFWEGAYCTTTYFNPTERPQASDVAYLPGSVLFMQIETSP